MKAADTRASSAIADCTPLTVVSRSSTIAEIETFISEVSTTSTNIAAARIRPSRELCGASGELVVLVSSLMGIVSHYSAPPGDPGHPQGVTAARDGSLLAQS